MAGNLADALVLPDDVVIVAFADLPAHLREQVGHDPGDQCVTRPHSRTNSTVVDAASAALLRRFREPLTIVDAVISFSEERGIDPRSTLEEVFPILRGFVDDGILVAADSATPTPSSAALAPGDDVDGLTVTRLVHRVIDTEVYRATSADGSAFAVKLATAAFADQIRARLLREAAILSHLDDDLSGPRISPRQHRKGTVGGRPYLAMTWCAGVELHRAADAARRLKPGDRLPALTRLAERVIGAYAELHSRHVLHGDVHPRNVLVDGDEQVTIIDFGLAAAPQVAADPPAAARGGVELFQEPEVAAARLAGVHWPPPTGRGEQYSVAALVYLLLTGAYTHDFSLEQQEMLRQVTEEPVLPFEERGLSGLPSVEQVLLKALSRRPDQRYHTTGAFLDAFRSAATDDTATLDSARHHAARTGPGKDLVDDVLHQLTVPGPLFPAQVEAPTASVMNGAAGYAYTLLRIAGIRDDAELLAQADSWCTHALAVSGTHDAFWNEELKVVPQVFGRRSFYHHVAGVHAVQALIAHARGDEEAQQHSVTAFVAVATQPCEHLDVAFGRAGLLLGCALVLETTPLELDRAGVLAAGAALTGSIWKPLSLQLPLAVGAQPRELGAAHGWAGLLYALLRWSTVSGQSLPDGFAPRLHELAGLGCADGRGMWWPYRTGDGRPDPTMAASWCNGAAGYVHLWTAAHDHFGTSEFAHLATQAAWTTYEVPGPAPGDLCCGFAGRAHALLCQYRHTGDPAWLARAHALAAEAVANVTRWSLRPASLYKGEFGTALLVEQITHDPTFARMPLFDSEGFPA